MYANSVAVLESRNTICRGVSGLIADNYRRTGTISGIYPIICLKYVDVRRLQVVILALSPREMSQTDRILPRYILS